MRKNLESFIAKLVESAEITVVAEYDDIPVRGNFDSGDAEQDRALEDSILDRLDRGDVWAWAYVRVQATAGGVTGEDTLGGCSYESEREFMQGGDYGQDMIKEARADLRKKLTDLLADGEFKHDQVEYEVGGKNFETFADASKRAMLTAVDTGEATIDVLVWDEAGAEAYGGEDAVERYREDPEASVFERFEIRVNNAGRVA